MTSIATIEARLDRVGAALREIEDARVQAREVVKRAQKECEALSDALYKFQDEYEPNDENALIDMLDNLPNVDDVLGVFDRDNVNENGLAPAVRSLAKLRKLVVRL